MVRPIVLYMSSCVMGALPYYMGALIADAADHSIVHVIELTHAGSL
jgi:hypothetical protein